MKAAVDQILARLRDQNVEVPADEVESRMRLVVAKFGFSTFGLALRSKCGPVWPSNPKGSV